VLDAQSVLYFIGQILCLNVSTCFMKKVNIFEQKKVKIMKLMEFYEK